MLRFAKLMSRERRGDCADIAGEKRLRPTPQPILEGRTRTAEERTRAPRASIRLERLGDGRHSFIKMKDDKDRGWAKTRSQGDLAMAPDAHIKLFQSLKTHKFELELVRGIASGADLEVLDRRIEAARLLLGWLAQALEPRTRGARNHSIKEWAAVGCDHPSSKKKDDKDRESETRIAGRLAMAADARVQTSRRNAKRSDDFE